MPSPFLLNTVLFYGGPVLLILGLYLWRKRYIEKRSRKIHAEELEAGLIEPPSLHPLIDPNICLGCGACVTACPEQNVLGLVDRKAKLIAPTHCIGHGACHQACPLGAISLVFGTETRGVDIPHVGPDFQTNIEGVYIAGELGGMGLIRNAVKQGRQAIDHIKGSLSGRGEAPLDLIIVGAGPAGMTASLAAEEQGLRYITLEQDSLGGTIAHYPRGKIVMTAPAELPLVGEMNFKETTKEALLSFWEDCIEKVGISVQFGEQVEAIHLENGAFQVNTEQGRYLTKTILLAIGRRGTPRRLEVPGEDLPKVVYRLIEPEQYKGQHVLVVGGGDSALEAALSIAEMSGAVVTLSYRGDAFSRAKKKNRERVEQAAAHKRLTVLLNSTINGIQDHKVMVNFESQTIELDNDAVIICAGGVLPTAFLRSVGIDVETKYGTA